MLVRKQPLYLSYKNPPGADTTLHYATHHMLLQLLHGVEDGWTDQVGETPARGIQGARDHTSEKQPTASQSLLLGKNCLQHA